MTIASIADLPFVEGAAEDVLGIGERATIDLAYGGFGWTRVPRLALEDARGEVREVPDALVLALHADDDGEARADDVLLDFTIGARSITCWLSAFLARWLPRLPASDAIVLAMCNPHGAVLRAPAGALHALGPVDSWLDVDEGGERFRLVAEDWRRIPQAPEAP